MLISNVKNKFESIDNVHREHAQRFLLQELQQIQMFIFYPTKN